MSPKQLEVHLRLLAENRKNTRTHVSDYHDHMQGKRMAEVPQHLIDEVRKARGESKRKLRARLCIGMTTLRRCLKIIEEENK